MEQPERILTNQLEQLTNTLNELAHKLNTTKKSPIILKSLTKTEAQIGDPLLTIQKKEDGKFHKKIPKIAQKPSSIPDEVFLPILDQLIQANHNFDTKAEMLQTLAKAISFLSKHVDSKEQFYRLLYEIAQRLKKTKNYTTFIKAAFRNAIFKNANNTLTIFLFIDPNLIIKEKTLLFAAQRGDDTGFRQIRLERLSYTLNLMDKLKENINVEETLNSKGEGDTALMIAVKTGNIDALKKFLEYAEKWNILDSVLSQTDNDGKNIYNVSKTLNDQKYKELITSYYRKIGKTLD